MEEVDVVVVGAGLAGLSAARYLLQKDPSLKVRVVEAKDRVGGRTLTETLKVANGRTELFDTGGQWIGNTQHHALQLLKELNIELYEQYTKGKKMTTFGGQIRSYEGPLPTDLSLMGDAVDLIRLMHKTDVLAKKVSVENPFDNEEIGKLDDLSVLEFTRRFAYKKSALEAVDGIARAVFGSRAQKLSMLYYLMYVRQAGGMDDLLEAVGDGAQRYKIDGGAQQMSKRMMAEVGEEKVLLSKPVHRVVREEDSVIVSFFDAPDKVGHRVDRFSLSLSFIVSINGCNIVIEFHSIRIPAGVNQVQAGDPGDAPNNLSHLLFQPPLPEFKQQLFNAFPMGHYTKFIVTYERAFWREAGLSGEIVSSGNTDTPGELNPLTATFDSTTNHGSPAIVGFLQEEFANLSPAERRAAVLKDLARFLGEEALSCVDYVDKPWCDEPYTGGCPTGVLAAGYCESFTRIREPDGRIHYAGTESATEWMGYMSGAIQSGWRAAAEVLRELRPQIPIPANDLAGSTYAMNYKKASPRKDFALSHGGHSTLKTLCLIAGAAALGLLAARRMGWVRRGLDFKVFKF